MGFDFTIAVVPTVTNIDRELQYVKSALLYADSILLISPLAYMSTQLSKGEAANERTILRMLDYIMPLYAEYYPAEASELQASANKLSEIFYSKKYKYLPMKQKIAFRRGAIELAAMVDASFQKLIGENQSKDLQTLLKSDRLHLQKFEHNLSDVDGCITEYVSMLPQSIKNSYPLFDELSNDLMVNAMKARIIQFDDIERRKITHAGLSDNMIQRLPAFDEATIDEILDIRKELDPSLTRYRAKMLSYSDSIQALPWDDSFKNECSELYYREVAPAVQEIAELTSENSFIRNLGYATISNGDFLKSVGGLICSIAAGGVIGAFNNAISTDKAVLISGSAWAVTKISESYREHIKNKREIEKKDLYFYYQAGKRLKGRSK